ncbi:MAG: Asp-tRNA(Asn)/Glu-tRNA(Gln) amidotransferase GatCAB subunit B, partial [Gammaproteobacteria bacterium]|nr:Asp-tRNA(Asn)/Glu-tRNA(Gln) amidotransferase GatCAB subunit B [Gammaproteobacteria bacterium]
LGLTDYDARWLAVDPDTAAYFDDAAAASGQPKATANWVMGDVAAAVRREDTAWTDVPVPAAQLGRLIERIEDGSISGKIAKSLFKTLWDDGGEVDELIESQGLKQVSDSDEIAAIVREVIDANPAQVEQVRSGRTRVLGFLVGQAMKASGGKANPKRVNELLREALSTDAT